MASTEGHTMAGDPQTPSLPSQGLANTHKGVHTFGLFIEGAQWNHEQKLLEDSLPLEMCCDFPDIYFLPTQVTSQLCHQVLNLSSLQ
jgi:hypothetical protein